MLPTSLGKYELTNNESPLMRQLPSQLSARSSILQKCAELRLAAGWKPASFLIQIKVPRSAPAYAFILCKQSPLQ